MRQPVVTVAPLMPRQAATYATLLPRNGSLPRSASQTDAETAARLATLRGIGSPDWSDLARVLEGLRKL